MTRVIRRYGCGWWLIPTVLLLSAFSSSADPINGREPMFEPLNLFCITIAILAEAFCVILLLRRRRTPRFFLLWLMGLHAVTYPVFLGLVWLCLGLAPWLVIVLGEGVIIVLEGILIWLMCRFAPSAKSALPSASLGKVLLAVLIGNVCSIAAYPLVIMGMAWIIPFFPDESDPE